MSAEDETARHIYIVRSRRGGKHAAQVFLDGISPEQRADHYRQLSNAVRALGSFLPKPSWCVDADVEADADFIKQQRDFPRLSNRACSPGLAAHRLRLFNRRQRHTAEAAVQRANERNQQVTARFLSAWGGHVGHPQIISDAAEPTGPAAPRNH